MTIHVLNTTHLGNKTNFTLLNTNDNVLLLINKDLNTFTVSQLEDIDGELVDTEIEVSEDLLQEVTSAIFKGKFDSVDKVVKHYYKINITEVFEESL